MAETKKQNSAESEAPALHTHNPIKPTALATAEERAIPVTHPDSVVVGADAYNRAVTVAPEAKGKP